MAQLSKITPCLWFDTQAEEAARFYVSVFEGSHIEHVSRYQGEAAERHGRAQGSVLAVQFRLLGQSFVALNGGPRFKFSEAISFQIACATQAEIDYFWTKLGAGGELSWCGWLKDRYGLSWQVVPAKMGAMMADQDARKVERLTDAFMKMQKFDLAALERAFRGE